MIVIKGLLSWHLRGAGSVFENQITRRNFGIVCGIEFGAGGLDALLLNLTNRPHLVAPWILLVVGAHFVWLAEILRDPGLQVLALLMVAGAVLAVI